MTQNIKQIVNEIFDMTDFYDMVDYRLDWNNYQHTWFNSTKADYEAIKEALSFVNNVGIITSKGLIKLNNKDMEKAIEYILNEMKRYAKDNPDKTNGYNVKPHKNIPHLNVRSMF